jgi:acid phosphatase
MTIRIGRRGLLRIGAGLALLPRVPAAARTPDMDFLIVGDWGRQGAWQQREVGAQMGRTAAAIGSRFVISVGDNFYENGVTSLSDPQWQSSFEAIYPAASLQTPWHVILGNHDYRGNVQAQLDYGTRSTRWNMPARYFMRGETAPDGTKADFFYIDTSPFITAYRGGKTRIEGQDTAAQLAWLDAALGWSQAAWKIVVGHHPVYTVARQRHDSPELIAQLAPMLQRHRVPVYLNGHDHNLQVRAVDGIHYITSGAGTQTSRVKAADTEEFASDRHGFMTAALSRDSFGFTFVAETGETVYQGRVGRSA